jgi:hypothetical protein
MPKRKTENEVRIDLAKWNIELLSEYIDSKTELELKCAKSGHIFPRTLNHINKNPKCPKCNPPITAR